MQHRCCCCICCCKQSCVVVNYIILLRLMMLQLVSGSFYQEQFMACYCLCGQYFNSVSSYALGSRVVSMLNSGAEGPGFRSQPRRCR